MMYIYFFKRRLIRTIYFIVKVQTSVESIFCIGNEKWHDSLRNHPYFKKTHVHRFYKHIRILFVQYFFLF